MSELKTFHCDGADCPNIKGASNHWWSVLIEDGVFALAPFDLRGNLADGVIFDLCGADCVSRKLAEYMQQTTARSRQAR